MDELERERRYWLALSACEGVGPVRFGKLLKFFGSAKKAWESTEKELSEIGLGDTVVQGIVDFRKEFSPESYETQLKRSGVSYLILQDAEYPHLLKKIKNPPVILYKKGTYSFNENDTLVSVVGTRKITEYGNEVTEMLVSDLVVAGCIVVSGLAMGVDALAHQVTIEAGGKTVAVLGSGVDTCTPAENIRLYHRILESGGAIVSEYPLGTLPSKGSFPARNRIIAGLSSGVLVTEGASDSGSLITANDAFQNNRMVFAVPGPINSSVSQGPISLIAKGAKIVMTGEDIVKEFNMKGIKRVKGIKSIKGLSTEESRIITVLQDQHLHFDELVKRTGFSPAQLGTMLSMLEMRGIVKSLEAGFFARISS